MTTDHANEAQQALWNGSSGHAWVDLQQMFDRMYAPPEALLVAAPAARRWRSRAASARRRIAPASICRR